MHLSQFQITYNRVYASECVYHYVYCVTISSADPASRRWSAAGRFGIPYTVYRIVYTGSQMRSGIVHHIINHQYYH